MTDTRSWPVAVKRVDASQMAVFLAGAAGGGKRVDICTYVCTYIHTYILCLVVPDLNAECN